MTARTRIAISSALLTLAVAAHAGGGVLGLDSRASGDATGIWSRGNQRLVLDLAAAGVIGGALWEGSDTRFGRTLWQSTDAIALGQIAYAVVNKAAGRLRPSQSSSPDEWGRSNGHSFPSGDVTFISASITPIVLEYGHDHPAVYALELLPAYDAVARVKSHAHWQSDVLAGWALGSAAGYYAHSRDVPLAVTVLPRGITVGIATRF